MAQEGRARPTEDPHPGFHSIREEVVTELPVEGSVPAWLSGSLIRNGPGAFELNGSAVSHWFDGLAMLRKFTFDDGAVRYQNRFLRSSAYEQALRGEFEGGFATGADASLLTRLKTFVLDDPYDNTNVVTERIGDRYLALTETRRRIEFEPETLETVGPVQYDGSEPAGQLACAHVHHDPWTGRVVNVETAFGRTSRYHVFELLAPDERHHVATVPTERPAYMHSFACTRNYVVLTEFPFVVDPMDMLTGEGSFIEHFEWVPEQGTRFIIIDRTSGGLVGEVTAEATFAFHHVNASETEEGDELVVDLETVPDAASIDALDLMALRDGELGVPAGALDRFRIGLSTDGPTVERERLFDGGMALPTVSPRVRMRPHRYVYAQGSDQPITEWPQEVVKIDTETGDVARYGEPGTYLSEPVFVPRADENGNGGDGSPEDVGVVLTVGLDTAREHSWLVVLDGERFDEVARAAIPHALPFDFHGRFFPELTG